MRLLRIKEGSEMFPLQQVAPKPAAPNDDVAALMLDERGMILDCNKSAERLLGYVQSDLVWRHVSLLVPHFESNAMFLEGQINPRIRYLCHCGHRFSVLDGNGQSFLSEIHLFEPQIPDRCAVRLILCT